MKNMKAAINDLYLGLTNYTLWWTLAWKDTRLRYTRTVLGPFWYTMSMVIFISTLGVLYSKFWGISIKEFLPYLTIGITLWAFLSTTLIESTGIFIASQAIIKQKPLPYTTFVLQLVTRNIIVFFHNFPVIVIVILIFDVDFNINVLLVVPGFVLLTLFIFLNSIILALLCTRFRDVGNLVGSLLQVAFFITPIFWNASQLGTGNRRLYFVDSNPFYHLIEIVRAPLLGHAPSYLSYIVVIFLVLLSSIFSLYLFSKFRSRIPFWI